MVILIWRGLTQAQALIRLSASEVVPAVPWVLWPRWVVMAEKEGSGVGGSRRGCRRKEMLQITCPVRTQEAVSLNPGER